MKSKDIIEYTDINDNILINNFYKILSEEYGFEGIFENIGIGHNLNIKVDELKKIKNWLEHNSEVNQKIDLIRELEIFRDISDDPTRFESQVDSIEKLYKLIIENLIDNYSIEYDLKHIDYNEILNYLKKSQTFSFRSFHELKDFKRDNLIHPIRVFLLGCYIISDDKNFWADRTWNSMLTNLNKIGSCFNRIFLRLLDYNIAKKGLSKDKFILKSIFYMWTISSLFHDIGRSIEDANEAIKALTNTYTNLPDFGWGYLKSYNGTKKTCKLCPTCLTLKPDEIGEKKREAFLRFLNWVPLPQDETNSIKIIIDNEYKKLDHGVISAILFTDYKYLEELESSDPYLIYRNPFRYFFGVLAHYSFISISLHNNPSYFFMSPLTQLLITVDTLQEWERITLIGDIRRKIYPCNKIKLKLYNFRFDDSKGKIIEAIIPFEEPTEESLKDIFKRRTPHHEQLYKKLNKSGLDAAVFNRFFIKGVELRIGYLEIKEITKEITKYKICGSCGKVIFMPTVAIADASGITNLTKIDMNDLFCSNPECETYGRMFSS